MKNVLVIFSAAVVAGLICYFGFTSLFSFGLQGNQVVLKIDVFIAFIASLGTLASSLALAFKCLVMRSDNRLVGRLESRIAELESRSVGQGSAGQERQTG